MKLHTGNEIAAMGGKQFSTSTWRGFCAFMPDSRIAIPWHAEFGDGFHFRIVSRARGAVWLKRRGGVLFDLLPSDIQHCTAPGKLRHL